MEYALILNSFVVNIIYLHPMHASDYPDAVPINGIAVEIGDEYRNGHFYREGKIVTMYPYEDERYGISPEILSIIKDDAVAEIEEAVINGTDE